MIARFKTLAKKYNYELYQKPYQLNIWGVRSRSVKSNQFDDRMFVFYKLPSGKWKLHEFACTTDPGTYWLNHPMMPQGTALLAQGQYKNVYQLGLHLGSYKALVQRKDVTVIRDYNRDDLLDFANGRQETGLFGINIHRARKSGSTPYIEKHSAGCQVLQNVEDFYLLLQLAERNKSLYGNAFTYTLIDQRALFRTALRKVVLGSLTLGLASATLSYFLTHPSKPIINNQKQINTYEQRKSRTKPID